MDITELHHLARWYAAHHRPLSKAYSALIQAVNHNTNNPNKVPLEEQLEALLDYLRGMDFAELSVQEIATLEWLEVTPYIGRDGAAFVDSTIRVANYDPATAGTRLDEAVAQINRAQTGLAAYMEALKALALDQEEVVASDDRVTVRIGFQNAASINDVTEWKVSAQDWYEIIRGVAMAADEAPEDTHIIGAQTGSIILILAATASVTFLLAVISKHVTSAAKNVISVGIESKRSLSPTLRV